MITEDYVSFDTAKLLKDKGFDVPIYTEIHKEFKDERPDAFIWRSERKENFNDTRSEGFYSCPTIQMAMKWLREVHNIHIGINPISGEGYNATIYDVADFDDYEIISDTKFFFHVEEACEAAVKHCLEKLI